MTTKPPPLKVHGLTIRHVMGIEEMEIAPGAVTLIEGRNGSGKSSVVEAIRSVLGRGHDATLVRKGSEKAEVVLILDNGMEIRREVDATGGTRVVATHPEMGRIAQPAGWLRGMVDGMWSPIELLRTANAKQRVQMLLEAMPLPVTPELATKVEKIIGHPPDAITTDHRAGGDRAGPPVPLLATHWREPRQETEHRVRRRVGGHPASRRGRRHRPGSGDPGERGARG